MVAEAISGLANTSGHVEVTVAGEHRRVALVAVADHFIQILLLVLGQRGETEIVQDKKSYGSDLAQLALVGTVAATGVDPVEQHAPALVGDLISLATGPSARAAIGLDEILQRA